MNDREDLCVICDLNQVVSKFFIDKSKGGIQERMIANTLTAREDRGVSKHRQEGTAVAIPLIIKTMEPI